jgi:hypothetical protein
MDNTKEIEDATKIWLSNNQVSLLNIMVISMIVSEQSSISDLDGSEKFKLSKLNFIKVLNYLENIGKITQKHVKYFQREFINNEDLIIEFTKIITSITNSPNLINKNKWISDNLKLR